MKTEQQLIDGLRKRKLRLYSCSIVLLVFVMMLMFYMRMYSRGISVINEYGQSRPEHLLPPEELINKMPEQLAAIAELSTTLSRVYTISVLFASLAGVFLTALLVEVFGLSKDRILIRLWDEVEILKKKYRS